MNEMFPTCSTCVIRSFGFVFFKKLVQYPNVQEEKVTHYCV